jgi:thermostable 8-oxoguanine DNA glycosylase
MTPEDRAILVTELTNAFRERRAENILSPEELSWVKNAIKAQNDMEQLRKAIIEKTLAGLIWAAVLGFGYLFVDFLRNHGLKI